MTITCTSFTKLDTYQALPLTPRAACSCACNKSCILIRKCKAWYLLCRGSPSAGHQVAFCPKQTAPEQPLSVQLHKMPEKPEMGKKRKKNRPHKSRAPGASHYKLCHEFQVKGHCTAVDCDFAHGQDVLDARNQERECVFLQTSAVCQLCFWAACVQQQLYVRLLSF